LQNYTKVLEYKKKMFGATGSEVSYQDPFPLIYISFDSLLQLVWKFVKLLIYMLSTCFEEVKLKKQELGSRKAKG
jgi:hypothetical protein